MVEKSVILGLYTITPLHPGSGAELSVIDLPIQRERHTSFPVIWGQSLKGVLRAAYKKNIESEEKTKYIFGPETDKADEHAACISVGDAKLLLFPIRSLKGVFAYVTCPKVIERFAMDIEFAGKSADLGIPDVNGDNKAVVSKNSAITVENKGKKVILEDVLLEAVENDKLYKIAQILEKLSPLNGADILSRLVIVSDNLFRDFVEMCTEVVARVRINAETGTVEEGGLWYEEFIPSDALFYSVIVVGMPRIFGKRDEIKNNIVELFKARDRNELPNKILAELKKFDSKFLHIGGDETVGKGFVKVKMWEGEQ